MVGNNRRSRVHTSEITSIITSLKNHAAHKQSHSWKLNLDFSAPRKGSPTGLSYPPGIRGVDELLEARVLKVLAEARLLLLDLAAAELRWRGRGCDRAHTRAELDGLAGHRLRDLRLFSYQQHQQTGDHHVLSLHSHAILGLIKSNCCCFK